MIFLVLLLLLAGAAAWIRWDASKHPDTAGHAQYFWTERAAVDAPTAPAAPAK